jgi:H+/Cl- antiporter ClcA
MLPISLPVRWNRKFIELRRMVVYAIPVGVLSGAGVAALETVCNRLLWVHLGTMSVAIRVVWPIVGLVISAYILHRLRVRTVGMLNEVVVHYHAPPASLSAREDVLKLGACVATVGLGASAGLGGPSQWLGARIALYVLTASDASASFAASHPRTAFSSGLPRVSPPSSARRLPEHSSL